ncbi:MAG: leucine-rich repeat domain-containing protein [Candidatus Poribacteria bacterium]|nr:leucine-rich repeat domain-containing protein [Candidatus Poribacteria bacterium]
MYKKLFLFIIALFVVINAAYAEDAGEWMPDPILRMAIRQELKIDADTPLTKADMLELVALDKLRLQITERISDLTGLESAINLELLILAQNRVQDLRPLANLTNLTFLDLGGNAISDVSPLAGLIRLEALGLWSNQIVDVSPLAGLVNLKDLSLNNNQIVDFSPLAGLVNLEVLSISGNLAGDISAIPTSKLTEFAYDESCNLEGVPVSDRIEDREYPSIFSAWANIINLPSLSWDERLAYHDLRFTGLRYGLQWRATPEGVKIFGDFEFAKKQRDAMLARNPNMIFLVTLDYYAAHPSKYPEDSPFWLRDELGNRIEDVGWGAFLIDFTLPEVQDYFVGQAIEIAKCGLYDGIFLDWWRDEWHGDELQEEPFIHYYAGDVGKAAISLLRRIREGVSRDDFLIIVNTNYTKIPRSAPYVNGTFMETINGRDYAGFARMESTLLWSEQNFQYPQINCLEGWADRTKPLDSPTNQRWMRVFTTLSLTHSNGYVNFVTGIASQNHTHLYEIWEGHSAEHARGEPGDHTHQHYWYDFWDADIGTPVGEKGQLYRNRDGLYIREFTNGWAVYNRSGKEQQIEFSEVVSGVASCVKDQRSHVLPDLDGEIYLKSESGLETHPTADVNGDGVVNIQDLVIVANALGKAEPDLNGDGVVNIQDLVIVANAFGNP